MNFTSQICTTKEQSERLLALGLKKETADCCWSFNIGVYDESRRYTLVLGKCEYMHDIPAWSLHRLIEMMPTVITRDDYPLTLGVNATCVYYADGEYAEAFTAFEGDLYNRVVKCIEWLIKEGYFNKEYLEE